MFNIEIPSHSFEEIRMDQIPKNDRWALIPLYQLSIIGEIQTWQIQFDGSDLKIYRNNEITETIKVSHNPLLEARKQYKLVYRMGYQPAGATTSSIIKPMHGYDYREKSIKNWPVYTQPQIIGLKMLCQDMGRGQLVMHYGCKQQLEVKHLEGDLKEFFEYLPKYAILDGELFLPGLNSRALINLLKNGEHHSTQYMISDIVYDDNEGTPFEKRHELLSQAFDRFTEDRGVKSKYLNITPFQIAQNHQEVTLQRDNYRREGYGGAIIKKISNGQGPHTKAFSESLYKSGLGNHILKYK